MAENKRTSSATGNHGDHVVGGTYLLSFIKLSYNLVSYFLNSAGTPVVKRPSYLFKQLHLNDKEAVKPYKQTGYPG